MYSDLLSFGLAFAHPPFFIIIDWGFGVIFFLIFIYLAVSGLSCGTRDLVVAACELLVSACGI